MLDFDVNVNVIERKIADGARWATVDGIMPSFDANSINILKITFDSTYPYFWIMSPYYPRRFIVSLTVDAITNALYEGQDGYEVDDAADGLFALDGLCPFCLAQGHRNSFYLCTDIISIFRNIEDWTNKFGGTYPEGFQGWLRISAQHEPVNPFGYSGPC